MFFENMVANEIKIINDILKNEPETVLNTINVAYMKILSSSCHSDFEGNYMLGTVLCDVLQDNTITNSQHILQLAKIAEDALTRGNPLTRGIVLEKDYQEIKRKMDGKFAVIEKYKQGYQ
jgi:hypothetical protein